MTELHAIALIGDLVDSRNSPDRKSVQRALFDELESFDSQDGFAATFELTAGDEIQALFEMDRGDSVMRSIQRVTDALYGRDLQQRILFGLGFGTVDTDLLPDRTAPRVSLLDGPCFHEARAALDAAKQRSTWVIARGFGVEDSQSLSSHLELIGIVRHGWTAQQAHYTQIARKHGAPRQRGAQKQAALEERVSPSVISESLKASHFDAVCRAEEAAANLIGSFAQKQLAAPSP